jgi:hypothetical protein
MQPSIEQDEWQKEILSKVKMMHHPVILKAFEKPATLFNTYLSVCTPHFGTV